MKKITTIYIDQEGLERLKEISPKGDLSLSQLVRKIVKEFLLTNHKFMVG